MMKELLYERGFENNEGKVDLFDHLDESVSDVVKSVISEFSTNQRTKTLYTQQQLEELIKGGLIRKATHDDHIEFPTDALFVGVDFRTMNKYFGPAKDVEHNLRIDEFFPSFVFTNCALINCHLPSESVLDYGSMMINGSTGPRFAPRDSILLGDLNVGYDSLVIDCDSRYGVRFGEDSKVISKLSYGVEFCKIEKGSQLLGGKLKGNEYGLNVQVLGSSYTNYVQMISSFLDSCEGKYLQDEFKVENLPKSSLILSNDGDVTFPAVMSFDNGLRHESEFPSGPASYIHKRTQIHTKEGLFEYQSIHNQLEAELLENLKIEKGNALNGIFNEHSERIDNHIKSFLSRVSMEGINLSFLKEIPDFRPNEDEVLISNIKSEISDAMVITMNESNSHKDISNDHQLAIDISDMANSAAGNFFDGKAPFKIKREDVKRMLVELVVAVPELKNFDTVKMNKYEDQANKQVFTGDHPFACIMTPEQYQAHKRKVDLAEAIQNKSRAKNSQDFEHGMEDIFKQVQVGLNG